MELTGKYVQLRRDCDTNKDPLTKVVYKVIEEHSTYLMLLPVVEYTKIGAEETEYCPKAFVELINLENL